MRIPEKVSFSKDTKHALLLKELLTKYSHVKWEDILPGLGIEVLFQILTGTYSSDRSVSPVTFWRYSRNFMALGIVTCSGEDLLINNRFSLLRNFLEEYQSFIIRAIVSSVSESAIVLWQKDFECLIRLPKTTEISRSDFVKTATSCLPGFRYSTDVRF